MGFRKIDAIFESTPIDFDDTGRDATFNGQTSLKCALVNQLQEKGARNIDCLEILASLKCQLANLSNSGGNENLLELMAAGECKGGNITKPLKGLRVDQLQTRLEYTHINFVYGQQKNSFK